MNTTIWVIAGTLWFIGSGFMFTAGYPRVGAMYIAMGCINIAVSMAQAS